MAQALPLSMRGLDPDIKEQVLEAAERSGMTAREWLNEFLAEALDAEQEAEREMRAERRGARLGRRSDSRVDRRYEALQDRLERFNREQFRDTSRNGGYRTRKEGQDTDKIEALIETALTAMERFETQRPAEADPVAASLQALERKIDQISRQNNPEQDIRAMRPATPSNTFIGHNAGATMSVPPPVYTAPASPPPQAYTAPPPLPPVAPPPPLSGYDALVAQNLADIETRRRQLDPAGKDLPARTPGGRPAMPFQRPADPPQRSAQGPASLDNPAGMGESSETRHLSAMFNQLKELTSRIDDMRTRPIGEPSAIKGQLDDLSRRIDQWRDQPKDEISNLRADLARLSAAIDQIAPARLAGLVAHAAKTMSAEAMRAQTEGLPERLLQPIERLQEEVRLVLKQVATGQGSDGLSKQVAVLTAKLDGLSKTAPESGKIEEVLRETEAIRALVMQSMRAQPMEGLVRQIEGLTRNLASFQKDSESERAILDAVGAIGQRIDKIHAGSDGKALAVIDQKIDALGQMMQKASSSAQPFPKLEAISERLERIDRVLDKAGDSPLGNLDAFSEKLDKVTRALEGAGNAPQKDQQQILGMLQQLAQKIDGVSKAEADSPALDALHKDVRNAVTLMQGMQGMSGDPAALTSIERGISELFDMIEDSRKDMQALALRAAEEAASKVQNEDSGDTLAAEGLLLIKRDLGEVRNAQSETDKHTRETLAALHATLQTMAGRLSEIESLASRPAQVVMAPPPAAPVAPSMMPPMPPGMTATLPPGTPGNLQPQAYAPASYAPGAYNPVSGAPVHAAHDLLDAVAPTARNEDVASVFGAPGDTAPTPYQPPNPMVGAQNSPKAAKAPEYNMADDMPLEPGMSPRDFSGGAPPTIGNDDTGRNNFIAAARRVAQNASNNSAGMLLSEVDSKGGIGNTIRTTLTRLRKPLLIGLAAIVISFGALRLAESGFGSGNPPISKPAVQSSRLQAPNGQQDPRLQGNVAQNRPVLAPRMEAPSAQPTEPTYTGSLPSLANEGKNEAPAAELAPRPVTETPDTKRIERLASTTPPAPNSPLALQTAPDMARLTTGDLQASAEELVRESNLRGQDKLKEAALSANPSALYELGARYTDGRGVGRDPKLGARWFELAANQNHAPSQYRLGALYREGRGVTPDAALARKWFEAAAAQGNILAMHNTAVLLAEGASGAPDYVGAALWFRKAAEHGVRDSQFNVGILLARGLGVNQDLGEAYRWFALAALQGDPEAGKKRDDVAARLPKDRLAKENDRIKAYRAQIPSPKANDPGNWEKNAKSGA